MEKVIIYLKLSEGKLHYRDSESDEGTTITTLVDPGTSVIWKKDSNSGIKKIKDIYASGKDDFFVQKPSKRIFSNWKARVSDSATGQISYKVTVDALTAELSTRGDGDPEPPIIKIKV